MTPARFRLGLVLGLGLVLELAGGRVEAETTGASVLTVPTPSSSLGGNASGTLSASTPTFQLLFSATKARKGCTVQNNSTHSMYVTEGLTTATATTGNSAVLAAGQAYYCQVGGLVLTGEVDIGGTSGDAFYATQY